MVHSKVSGAMIKAPYEEIKKIKDEHSSSSQQIRAIKNEKYGSWGPIYKNKQNFIDMHIC